MTHREWPNREEWATHRRAFYGDMLVDLPRTLADYSTPEEVNAATAALKVLYTQEGYKMRAAKREAGPLASQPGESERAYFDRYWAMSEPEKDTALRWTEHQINRKEIRKALSAFQDGIIPYTGTHMPAARATFAAIEARYDAANRASHDAQIHKIETTPIDDKAWEAELCRRAALEQELASDLVVKAA